MIDTELADKVVALEVGRYWPDASPKPRYDMANGCMFSTSEAPEFLRDWRVAGALMEKCYELDVDVCPDSCDGVVEAIFTAEKYMPLKTVAIDDSLPRAIIEACVEALA